jgi:translocation and assembly module TamB
MADDSRKGRDESAHEARRLSTLRLFLIVLLFLALAAYAIWNSDRFQSLFQGVSQQRLSELLQRPVRFRRVDFHIFPPSVTLADVSVGNDPRTPDEPLLAASELTIGGGMSITGGELRFGRVRAVGPKIALAQFPDGTWNLPPGLTGPSKGGGGLKVRVGELVVVQGFLHFEGRKMDIDGRFEDFAVQVTALPRNRYNGTLACRRATLRLPSAEPMVLGLDLRFRIDPETGAAIESLRANGEFGELRATGSVDNFKNPTVLLLASGDVHIAEVERIFRLKLGFAGDASVRADVRVAGGGFRITGNLSSAKIDAKDFPIEDLQATVLARPEALLARIERARYAGGEASGVFRIENLAGKGPQPMTLVLDAKRISMERFFADLKLPGTGLSGAASLTASLRWGAAGLERANGGATLSVDAGPASSLVRGRFGVPISGGGALTIVDGRIGFEGTTFRFPASSIALTGGMQIGHWLPDFDFQLRSRDLTEMDHLFQNFTAASGSKPKALGLGGSGDLDGHIARSWGEPEVTTRISAENARYAGVLFGSVRGTAEMHEGAFVFHPLRIYEGSATLSLEGTVRYRHKAGNPDLEVTVSAKDYPAQRLLDYLDLEYPIQGRVTGTFPLSGDMPDGVSGGGTVVFEDAVLWGQKVERLSGRVELSPGKVAFDEIRADVEGGMIGGRGSIAYREKTFEVRAAGDGIPFQALQAVQDATSDVSGSLTFEISGSGSFDRPDLDVSATLTDATFFGHAIPPGKEPRLSAKVSHGELDATVTVEKAWTLKARGEPFATPGKVDADLDAPDLAALLLFTPLGVPEGAGGAVAATGHFTLPDREGAAPEGEVLVTSVRLDLPEHPGLLRAADARIRIADRRFTLEETKLVGEGVELAARLTLDVSGEKTGIDARLTGSTDAAILGLVAPDTGFSGKLMIAVAATGTLDAPAWNGSVRIENGRYRVAGYTFTEIEGTVRVNGTSGEIEGVRAKVSEGEALAAGNFQLEGASLKEYRLAVQGRRVQVRAIPSLRLTVDADLVLNGTTESRELRGEISLLKGTYSKDVELTVSDLLARSRPGGAVAARQHWMERTSLDVRIVSAAALEVRNNLARLSGMVDLTARGTLADPVLLGQILLDEGGRVVFSDVRYEIENGVITFANTARIAPFIDIRARADIKGYDLVVSLVGTWPRITPTFTSDPPLSNDAILGLILSGVPPDTRASVDTSGQLVSAAGGVISGAVTSPLTRGTARLFKLDRFQIDPVFQGSTLSTFRTTIGKQITQDLSVTSSIAIDSSKDPIIRVEWQATDTLLIQLIRDENGILTLSFRKRQRL